jgi:hypothetical protein
VTCVCGNAIDDTLARLGSVTCRFCREDPERLREAIESVKRPRQCPSPGCREQLALDEETPVLRCATHGPMIEAGRAGHVSAR